MPNKFEEKLGQLSVSEREGLEKLNKKVPKFISLTPHKNVVAEYPFIVVERKKERERNYRKWGILVPNVEIWDGRESGSSTSDEEGKERKEKEASSPRA